MNMQAAMTSLFYTMSTVQKSVVFGLDEDQVSKTVKLDGFSFVVTATVGGVDGSKAIWTRCYTERGGCIFCIDNGGNKSVEFDGFSYSLDEWLSESCKDVLWNSDKDWSHLVANFAPYDAC